MKPKIQNKIISLRVLLISIVSFGFVVQGCSGFQDDAQIELNKNNEIILSSEFQDLSLVLNTYKDETFQAINSLDEEEKEQCEKNS